MQLTTGTMKKLADEVEVAASTADGLAVAAQRIGVVLTEIQGIANQTNLLGACPGIAIVARAIPGQAPSINCRHWSR